MKRSVLILLLVCISNSFSNMSAPPEPFAGDIIGENAFPEIEVSREDLFIDFSGIKDHGYVEVYAKYEILLLDSLKNQELIFIANNLDNEAFEIKIDGKNATGIVFKNGSIPELWRVPDSLYFFQKNYPFLSGDNGLFKFNIQEFFPGKHTIEVKFSARTAEWFEEDYLSKINSFVYVLKASNKWKSFKNLYMTVILPEDFEYESNLDFQTNSNDTLKSYWKELPKHHFSIAFKVNENKAVLMTYLYYFVMILLSVLLVFLLLYFKQKIIIKRGKKYNILNIFLNIIFSIPVSLLYYWIYFTESNIKNYFLHQQLNPYFNHHRFYDFLTFPISFTVVVVLVIIFDRIIRNRLLKNYSEKTGN